MTEIAKLKKSIADLEQRIVGLESTIQTLQQNYNTMISDIDLRNNTLMESIKANSSVQVRVILEQIRNEIRMEFFKIQRDLQRDIRGLRV